MQNQYSDMREFKVVAWMEFAPTVAQNEPDVEFIGEYSTTAWNERNAIERVAEAHPELTFASVRLQAEVA